VRRDRACEGVTLPVTTTGPHAATHAVAGRPAPVVHRRPADEGLLEGMKDAEIVALASYFAAQKPVPAAGGSRDEALFQRGQALASRALCGSCHLPDFSGRRQIPRLAGQHEAFLLQSMKQFRDHPGPGRDTIMAASLYGLKDQELADLAHFLAHYR
jgi:cytochrome c553